MVTDGNVALAWVVLAVIAGIVEISIPHFGVIFVSIAAIAAAFAASVGLGLVTQSVIFVVALALCLTLLRPRLVTKLGGQGVPSRTGALIGREGVVTHDIEPVVGAGRVNVGGEDWAARAKTAIPAGTRVRVAAADGIVLEVTPI
jgi:membrane protein implicated in regulation of membrane protease activity